MGGGWMGRVGASVAHAAIAAALPSAIVAANARAQGVTVVGLVTARSHAVADAEVLLEGTVLEARTNGAGEYRIHGVPPGRYAIAVRMIGYRGAHDSVVVGSSDTRFNIVLIAEPTAFVAAVSATAPPTSTSMQISRVESPAEHAGRFLLNDDALRASASRMTADVLAANFTEARVLRREPASAYVYAERPNLPDTRLTTGDRPLRTTERLPSACYVTLYVDGKLVYDLDTTRVLTLPDAPLPPDVNAYRVDGLSAIEFYPGDAALPVQYHTGGCGTLLFWSRQK